MSHSSNEGTRPAALAVLSAGAGAWLVRLDLELQLRLWNGAAMEHPWLTHLYVGASWAHWLGPLAGIAAWALLRTGRHGPWLSAARVIRFSIGWLIISGGAHLLAMSHAKWAMLQWLRGKIG